MSELSPRMKRFEEAGLLGCLNGTGVTSTNYKDVLMGEWISVKDRVPEEGEVVLTYSDPYIRTAEILYRDENRALNWLDGGTVFGQVTHWMPLPNPPEEK